MTTDEAMDLALEALEVNNQAWKSLADSGDAGFWEAEEQPFYELSVKAITAIKQARALDRKAENARELGLDYEPAAWNTGVPPLYPEMKDGETISVEYTTPPAQPAPVQEPVAWRWVPSKVWGDYVLSDDPQKAALAREHGINVEALCKCTPPAAPVASVPIHPKTGPLWAMTTNKPDPERLPSYPLMNLYTTPPAAQTAKPLTDEEIRKWWSIENGLEDCKLSKLDDFTLAVRAIEAKLKERNV